MRIRVNIFPPGGYRFTESDGTLILGKSWREVTAKVIAYRKRAGLSAGDPAKEVNDQHCAGNPGNCYPASPDVQTAKALKVATLRSRLLAWFSQIRKAGVQREFVSAELAQQRANTCLGCPQNQSLPNGCGSCKKAVQELRNDVIGGRAADGRLVNHGCNILGEDLATAVWLDRITVDNSELPSFCWRRRGP